MAEGDWHKGWKDDFGLEFSEKKIGNNRADIVAPDGTVIELQHSSISDYEIAKRENAYGKMAWIIDILPMCSKNNNTYGYFASLFKCEKNPIFRFDPNNVPQFNDKLVRTLFAGFRKDLSGYIVTCPWCDYGDLRVVFKNMSPFIKCRNGCKFLPIERKLIKNLRGRSINVGYDYFQEMKDFNEAKNIESFKYRYRISDKNFLGYKDYIYSNYPYIIKPEVKVDKWIERPSIVLFDLRNGYVFMLKEIDLQSITILGGYLFTRKRLVEFFKKGTYA